MVVAAVSLGPLSGPGRSGQPHSQANKWECDGEGHLLGKIGTFSRVQRHVGPEEKIDSNRNGRIAMKILL